MRQNDLICAAQPKRNENLAIVHNGGYRTYFVAMGWLQSGIGRTAPSGVAMSGDGVTPLLWS